MHDFLVSKGHAPEEMEEFREQWENNLASFNNRADAPGDRTVRQKPHGAKGETQRPQDPHKTHKQVRLPALMLLRALDQSVRYVGYPLKSFEVNTAESEPEHNDTSNRVQNIIANNVPRVPLTCSRTPIPATLIVHSDEGSSNLAAINYLQSRLRQAQHTHTTSKQSSQDYNAPRPSSSGVE